MVFKKMINSIGRSLKLRKAYDFIIEGSQICVCGHRHLEVAIFQDFLFVLRVILQLKLG